jgi:tRNA-splicing ligase RtcB
MPIGGVIAYAQHVSPSAVGFDIACGNMAVRTNVPVSDVNVKAVMDDVWKQVAFGVGRQNHESVAHPVLDEIASCDLPVQREMAHQAEQQLGTVGSGNHYVDIFGDENGMIWVGVHFGSRGLGHKTATWALEQAGATGDDMHAPPVVIPLGTALADAYIDGMNRAGRYAYAGREWVVGKVLSILGASAVETVHNHHNFAWLEEHDGQQYWVHRKGATPAFPGQRGFVGATMGEPSVILEGLDHPTSALALYSTVHGAGRAMSRRKAAGKVRQVSRWKCQHRDCDFTAAKGGYQKVENGPTPVCPKCGHKLRLTRFAETVSPGLIDFPTVQADIKAKGIELRGAGADEAPGAYKRLDEVLAHHVGTVRVLHALQPLGVAMAGSDVYDPWKD